MTCCEKPYGFCPVYKGKCTKRPRLVKKSRNRLDSRLTNAMMNLASIRVILWGGIEGGVLRRFVGSDMRGIKEWMNLSDHFGKTTYSQKSTL